MSVMLTFLCESDTSTGWETAADRAVSVERAPPRSRGVTRAVEPEKIQDAVLTIFGRMRRIEADEAERLADLKADRTRRSGSASPADAPGSTITAPHDP